jgi:hypothetical protein
MSRAPVTLPSIASEERFAILYSDGSIGIGTPGESLEGAIKTAADDNKGESRPENLAKVARVRIEILEIITTPGAKPHAAECPCCKRPLP